MGYDWPPKGTKPKVQKYNNERRGPSGSKLERAVYQILLLREKSGEISDIKQQVRVHLGYEIYWKVDFSFIQRGTISRRARRVWCEAKGCEDARYRMCYKLWKGGHGPGELEIWKGSYERPFLAEILKP